MRRILILEDEYFLLQSMCKYLGGMENVRVKGCMNLREAREYLNTQGVDLIFSDINLPDGSGLELINFMATQNLYVPLVFVSAYISDFRDHIPPQSNIMMLEKPISLKRLRGIAEEKLEALASKEEGDDYVFKLSDYLQIAAMGGHTVRLELDGLGTILVVDGQPWSATDEKGEGLDAFKRIVAETEVHNHCVPIHCRRMDVSEAGTSNLDGTLENLLLNAVWAEEEAVRNGETQILEEADQGEASGKSLQTLVDEGVECLLSREYMAAVVAFEAAHAMDPNHATVRANLDRLHELGYFKPEEVAP